MCIKTNAYYAYECLRLWKFVLLLLLLRACCRPICHCRHRGAIYARSTETFSFRLSWFDSSQSILHDAVLLMSLFVICSFSPSSSNLIRLFRSLLAPHFIDSIRCARMLKMKKSIHFVYSHNRCKLFGFKHQIKDSETSKRGLNYIGFCLLLRVWVWMRVFLSVCVCVCDDSALTLNVMTWWLFQLPLLLL